MTAKQKKFVNEYLIDGNATQAAMRAGYSKKTAGIIGDENLKKPNIAAAIEKRQSKLAEKLEITQERVLAEYAKIAFSDMRKFSKWGADGVELIDSDSLSDNDAACVAEVSQTITKDGGSIRFKLHDKKGALDSICKMLGYNAPDKKDTREDGMDPESDLNNFEQALDSATAEAFGDEEAETL